MFTGRNGFEGTGEDGLEHIDDGAAVLFNETMSEAALGEVRKFGVEVERQAAAGKLVPEVLNFRGTDQVKVTWLCGSFLGTVCRCKVGLD